MNIFSLLWLLRPLNYIYLNYFNVKEREEGSERGMIIEWIKSGKEMQEKRGY
jgi:hypothetical protein